MKTLLKAISVFAALGAVEASAAQCELASLFRESRLAQTELEKTRYELQYKRAALALAYPARRDEILGEPLELPSSNYLYDARISDEHAYEVTCRSRFLNAAKYQVSAARTTELVRLMAFDTYSEIVGK